jgi:fatty acid amide hydrolase 2
LDQGPFDTGALELAAGLRARRLSAVELVRGHIQRIEAHNPALNAVVAERFEAAMEEARQADARLRLNGAQGDPPPLLGIPFTAKEFLAVRGMPHTGGLVGRRHVRAPRDAPVIARLRAAGAILLGVTNAPEGGLSTETYNRLYGRTVNPWNIKHTSGGSSGGEGACIGAGLSAFGVGSDLGGSIRIPAAFCGCVGHKPTPGLVPLEGHFPMPHGSARDYLAVGPLARRVADIAPLLGVMSGREAPLSPLTPAPPDLHRITVYPIEHNHRTPATPSMRGAILRATEVLRARGARIGEYPARRFARSVEMWSARVQEQPGPPYADILGVGEPIRLRREAPRWLTRRSDHTFAALAVVALERATRGLDDKMVPARAAADSLQRDLEATLGRDAVLLFPPYPRPAPRHSETLRKPLDFAYAGIFNVLKLPVTQVPTGFDPRGLPVGVQVVGGPGMDSLTLAVAQVIEDEIGGWVRPERTGRGVAS